jgi:hypothetical protein
MRLARAGQGGGTGLPPDYFWKKYFFVELPHHLHRQEHSLLLQLAPRTHTRPVAHTRPVLLLPLAPPPALPPAGLEPLLDDFLQPRDPQPLEAWLAAGQASLLDQPDRLEDVHNVVKPPQLGLDQGLVGGLDENFGGVFEGHGGRGCDE